MRLIVTRPGEDGDRLAAQLRGAGHDVLSAPMLRIDFLPGPAPDLSGAQAVLATSANGVRAFAERSTDRDLPLLAVGDATARAAEAAGFKTVLTASGDVTALAALAIRSLQPAAGHLVHVAGSKVAGDLAGQLTAAGFAVDRLVLYEAVKIEALPDPVLAGLEEGAIDGVLLYSPRTAKAFSAAAPPAARSRLTAYCLSDAVAEAAGTGWGAIKVAEKPDQDSLLALLRG